MKKMKQNFGIVSNKILSVIVAVSVALLLTLALSICIINEYLNISNMNYVMLVTHAVSVFIGAVLSCKLNKENKMTAVAIMLTGYLLTQLVISILIFDGVGKGIVGMIVACIIGATSAFPLSNINKKAGNKQKRRKSFR